MVRLVRSRSREGEGRARVSAMPTRTAVLIAGVRPWASREEPSHLKGRQLARKAVKEETLAGTALPCSASRPHRCGRTHRRSSASPIGPWRISK